MDVTLQVIIKTVQVVLSALLVLVYKQTFLVQITLGVLIVHSQIAEIAYKTIHLVYHAPQDISFQLIKLPV